MEENTPKTAPAVWEEKFGDSGDLSLSPVRVEELEGGCNPGKCGRGGKELELEMIHVDFVMTEEAKEFKAVGTATISVKFFYYSNGKSYPGKDIPFKDRITWAGDLNKKDASIVISNMQFRDNGTYICDVKNPPDIVVKPGEIRVRVVEKDSLPAFPIATVAGIAIGTVTGLTSLISIVVCLVIRKNNSKKRYSGVCELLLPGLAQSQGPVIYAQLDHSGGQHSDKINKSESVVYADIRKN
ncbi:Myelin protein zero-like protein 1 [Turdus rufiventris]|nr:Myelin protein zero-like protein 1 [Turdus rufiventris]